MLPISCSFSKIFFLWIPLYCSILALLFFCTIILTKLPRRGWFFSYLFYSYLRLYLNHLLSWMSISDLPLRCYDDDCHIFIFSPYFSLYNINEIKESILCNNSIQKFYRYFDILIRFLINFLKSTLLPIFSITIRLVPWVILNIFDETHNHQSILLFYFLSLKFIILFTLFFSLP